MAPLVQVANDILWAAILVALPVSPRQFLEWTRLERLAFLTGLLQQSEWRQRPYALKTFGRLLQIPHLTCPRLPLPDGLIPFWYPADIVSAPWRKGLTLLEHRRLIRRQAGIHPRLRIRRQLTH